MEWIGHGEYFFPEIPDCWPLLKHIDIGNGAAEDLDSLSYFLSEYEGQLEYAKIRHVHNDGLKKVAETFPNAIFDLDISDRGRSDIELIDYLKILGPIATTAEMKIHLLTLMAMRNVPIYHPLGNHALI